MIVNLLKDMQLGVSCVGMGWGCDTCVELRAECLHIAEAVQAQEVCPAPLAVLLGLGHALGLLLH